MADTKRAAAHRRPGPERGVAAYTRTPEREQTIIIGWSMNCSVVDGQGKRGNVHIPAIMSVAFADVVVFDGVI